MKINEVRVLAVLLMLISISACTIVAPRGEYDSYLDDGSPRPGYYFGYLYSPAYSDYGSAVVIRRPMSSSYRSGSYRSYGQSRHRLPDDYPQKWHRHHDW